METIPSLLVGSLNEDCAEMAFKQLSCISQAALQIPVVCYSKL